MSMFKLEDRICQRCQSKWSALTFWDEDMCCHDCGRKDYDEALAAVNDASRPYHVAEIGGACPMQVSGGWVDGQKFYFRARHGSWSLRVDPDDPVMGAQIASGADPSHGWMDWDDALALIDAAAKSATTPASGEGEVGRDE